LVIIVVVLELESSAELESAELESLDWRAEPRSWR